MNIEHLKDESGIKSALETLAFNLAKEQHRRGVINPVIISSLVNSGLTREDAKRIVEEVEEATKEVNR